MVKTAHLVTLSLLLVTSKKQFLNSSFINELLLLNGEYYSFEKGMKRRTFHTIEENAWIEKKREEEGKLEKVSSFTRQYWLKSIHLYRRTTNIARRWRRKLLGMSLLFWIQKMKKYLVPIFKSLTYKEFFRSCTMLCLDKTAFWFTELEPITRDFVAAALEEWASFVSDWDPIVKMSHQKKEDPEKRTTQSDGSGLVSRTHRFHF